MINNLKVRNHKILLISIIILGFILRMLFFWGMSSHIERAYANPDITGYMKFASNLLSRGVSFPDNGKLTPVYPAFIAATFSINGENPVLLLFFQILISTFEIFMTYQLGRRLFPKSAALIGALMIAVGFESITYTFYFLTEGLFTSLLLSAIYFWLKGLQESDRISLVFSGVLMGLTVLCRPIALFFPIVLALLIVFQKIKNWQYRVINSVIFLGIFLLTITPWIVRNNIVIGVPTVSTMQNYNLLYYNALSLESDLTGNGDDQTYTLLEQRVAQLMVEKGWANTVANQVRADNIVATQIIMGHPFRYVYLHLKTDINSFLPDVTNFLELLGLSTGGKGTREVLNHDGVLAAINTYFGGSSWLLLPVIILCLFTGCIYILDLVGLFYLFKNRDYFPAIILLAISAYYLLIPGAPSVPRFRIPVMPYLSLLAGWGLFSLRGKK